MSRRTTAQKQNSTMTSRPVPTPEVRAFAAARYRLLDHLERMPYSVTRARAADALSYIEANETMSYSEKAERLAGLESYLDEHGWGGDSTP